MKHYKLVKDEINKLLTAKVIQGSWSSWISIHHSSTKGRWRKTSSHWLQCAQQDHMKIYLAYAKGRRHFCPTQWCKILLNPGSMSRISPHPIGWVINTQNSLHLTIWKIWICQGTLQTCSSTCIFPGTHDRCPKRLSFCYCLPGWYNHLQQNGSGGTPRPHQASFLKKLWNANLSMKLSKCHFFAKEIQYLGHILSTTGIRPTTIQRLKPSRTCNHLKQLSRIHAFLGLVRYYRKFIKDFAKMAKPLTLLTHHKAKFDWTPVHHTAFMTLKEAIIQAPILCYPDPARRYIVYMDASDDACGAQLSQEHDGAKFSVAFLSHTFTETQRKWSTPEQEAYRVYYAITK